LISNNEKSLGVLFLSILGSKSTIGECISKSGLTADNISKIISIPEYEKYFVKSTDKELRISCRTKWISEDMSKNIRISKSETKILKEAIKKKFVKHVSKYWNDNGIVQRDFELKSLSDWVISEYVFVSGVQQFKSEIADIIISKNDYKLFKYKKLKSGVSGSGDFLGALFLVYLSKGFSPFNSAENASKITHQILQFAKDKRYMPLHNLIKKS